MRANKDYLNIAISLIPTESSRIVSRWDLEPITEADYPSLCNFMFGRMQNTPYLFRVTGQFGVDPDVLNYCLPAGSIQQERWAGDPVLNQYMINGRFTVLTLVNAIGVINSTFANSQSGVIPTLVSVIGDVSTLDFNATGVGKIPSLVAAIGAGALHTPVKTDLVSAINYVIAEIGDNSTLNTDTQVSLVASIDEMYGYFGARPADAPYFPLRAIKLNGTSSDYASIVSIVGTDTLKTANQTSLVAAINEVRTDATALFGVIPSTGGANSAAYNSCLGCNSGGSAAYSIPFMQSVCCIGVSAGTHQLTDCCP